MFPITHTLEEARALGLVIDYPAHPRGEGMPYVDGRDVFRAEQDQRTHRTRFLGVHVPAELINNPIGGFLVRDAAVVPCYGAGYTRETVLAHLGRL